eukprot:4440964-Pyramimonas_sp.AAC.1
MEAILNNTRRRQRLLAMCIEGTPMAEYASDLETFTCSLYEARWHEVHKFVKAVKPLMTLLSATWDPQKYEAGVFADDVDVGVKTKASKASAQFNIEMFSATIKDKAFKGFLALVLQLDRIPEQIASWSEGC